ASSLSLRICHITPHLPPDQAANALLPYHLGWWSREAGHEVSYVAHPPRAAASVAAAATRLAGPVAWVQPNRAGSGAGKLLRFGSVAAAVRIARAARPLIAAADV